jgi:hypothetical protein
MWDTGAKMGRGGSWNITSNGCLYSIKSITALHKKTKKIKKISEQNKIMD